MATTDPTRLLEDNPKLLRLRGPRQRGVVITDAGGVPRMLKFTGDQTEVLTGDGSFQPMSVVAPGAGDVVGPASAVDDRIATFDGVTGKLIQDGGATIAGVLATAGDVDGPSSAGDDRIATFDGTSGKLIQDGGLTIAQVMARTTVITVTFTNPVASQQTDLYIPVACTITAARLFGDAAGSIIIDIWRDDYADFAPDNSDSITSSSPPELSTESSSEDTTLSGWTTAIVAGSVLRFNVDSTSGLARAVLVLTVTVP